MTRPSLRSGVPPPRSLEVETLRQVLRGLDIIRATGAYDADALRREVELVAQRLAAEGYSEVSVARLCRYARRFP
jgi:predicted Ser/Thr protein kinase